MTTRAGSGAQATILHVDMDAFYAAVEQLDRPDLKGKPMLVGGKGGRSVVSSANYEARRYGIRSAMPVAMAIQRCPAVVVLDVDMPKYVKYSRQVMQIFERFTPLVQKLSIDEAFLDVSGATALFGSPQQIAATIRATVLAETGLTCSIGVAENKSVAKIASDLCKPDGMLVVPAGTAAQFLAPLPVSRLWGAGQVTQNQLERLGIRTIGQLADTPVQTLVSSLGEVSGRHLSDLAHGIDSRSVDTEREEKSIGNEVTFAEDTMDPAQLRATILRQSGKVGERLRALGLTGRTVVLKLKFFDFTVISRSRTLPVPTDIARVIYREAVELLESVEPLSKAVRLIGVRVQQLGQDDSDVAMFDLFSHEADAWDAAERAVDEATKKFGTAAVTPARLLRRSPSTATPTGRSQPLAGHPEGRTAPPSPQEGNR